MAHELNMLEILQEFNLNRNDFLCVPLAVGLINDTYLVTDTEGEQFILQKINKNVFKNAGVLMDNIGHALPFLTSDNYAQISFVPTKTGKNYLVKEDNFWRMMTYIPDSTTYNTTSNTNTAFEAGRIVGEFHRLLKKADVDLFEDTLAKFHDLEHRANEFEEALATSEVQKREIAGLEQ